VFGAVTREVGKVTTIAGLSDLSVFSCFECTGKGVEDFLGTLGTNTAPKPRRIGLMHTSTTAGTVGSEFTIARLSVDHAMITSAAAAEEIDLDVLNSHAYSFDVMIENASNIINPIAPMILEAFSIITSNE
jgi:dimethylglycine dehydrogenase